MARRKTDAEIERENQTAGAAAVVIVLVLLAAFLLAPGIMLVAFCLRPFVELDRGQMWIFSVVGCLLTVGGLRIAFGSWRAAFRYYTVACVVAVGAFALAKFGFHAEWPDLMWDEFANEDAR